MNQLRHARTFLKQSTVSKFLSVKFFAVIIAMLAAFQGFTQNAPATKAQPNIIRCGTMQYYAEQMRLDPLLEQKATEIANRIIKEAAANRGGTANRPQGTQAVIVIPVVFHVVGSAANQTFVSDDMVQRQVDVLNRDFAGLNADTAKLPPAFRAILGHSIIRFALAKRTPTGTTTNGVERRVTALTFTSASASYNTILKHTAAGGLDQWDGAKYLNVWVANFTDGLLGVATFPNVTPPLANEQGVAIHFGSIDQPCGSPFVGLYDGGRTLVHEVGHYFYLFHIWGDDGGACTGSDFRTPYGALPATCTDDTPNQEDASNGCPAAGATLTDACTATGAGIMYQNYMDYSGDACMSMLTVAQACRAEATLDLYRASLKTSDGLIPLPANVVNNDVRVSEILSPVSRGFACGTTTSICSAPFNAQVLIVNDGDAPLTSLTFSIIVDGVAVGTQSWTGNLQPADFTYVTINNIASVTGPHVLTIKTLNPNGQVDGRPLSDSSRAAYSVLPPAITVPTIAESFEGTTFPPAGWRIDNPNTGSITWARTTLAGNPGTASARVNSYAYTAAGHQDIFISPKLSTTGYDSLIINFNVAYAKYSNLPIEWESLEVVYSTDCGITWKPTGYFKAGNELATNGGAIVTTSFTPIAAEWRAETIKIGLCGITSDINIGFRSTNNYGNNLYIDNIRFDRSVLPDPNVELTAVIEPNGLYCTGAIQPKVTLFNKGTTTLTTVRFNYRVDNATNSVFTWTGSLPKCSAPIIVSLPAINVAAGSHTFTVFTNNPNGIADAVPSNDTARANFAVISVVTGPIAETFEGTTFPPANWAVQNFDNSTTFVKTTTAAQAGNGSMVINNFSYPVTNTIDRFVSPRVILGTPDSAFVSFDYSYNQGAQYPGSTVLPLDTLELLITTNCGATTTTIWKKWGEDLQTQNEPNYSTAQAYTPVSVTQWKNAKINILPFIGAAPDFQIYFTAKSNKQNNLYIDNINIVGKTLPARLKDQGYQIYPNPFGNSFRIHHLMPPTELRSAQVYNAAGQLVWDKRFNGAATTEVEVDLKNLAKGVYILKMIYTNKTVVERIVKN